MGSQIETCSVMNWIWKKIVRRLSHWTGGTHHPIDSSHQFNTYLLPLLFLCGDLDLLRDTLALKNSTKITTWNRRYKWSNWFVTSVQHIPSTSPLLVGGSRPASWRTGSEKEQVEDYKIIHFTHMIYESLPNKKNYRIVFFLLYSGDLLLDLLGVILGLKKVVCWKNTTQW